MVADSERVRMLCPIELVMMVTGGGMEVIWKVRFAARRGGNKGGCQKVLWPHSLRIVRWLTSLSKTCTRCNPFLTPPGYPSSQIPDPNSSLDAQT